MIKINLLESVTDRPQGVAAVEDKVASRAHADVAARAHGVWV